METFKYSLIIDTYNFTYSAGKDFTATFLISVPVVKKDDLVHFLKGLETNTTATLEIKTDTQLSFFLTTGNGFCNIQERFSIFIQSARINLSHDICLNVMKKFINELLILSMNSEQYNKWKVEEQVEMSEMHILRKENQVLKQENLILKTQVDKLSQIGKLSKKSSKHNIKQCEKNEK